MTTKNLYMKKPHSSSKKQQRQTGSEIFNQSSVVAVQSLDPELMFRPYSSLTLLETNAKTSVLLELRARAKVAGKWVRGSVDRMICGSRCSDTEWLTATLQQMRRRFAAEIEQSLRKLNHPTAERESLTAEIFSTTLKIHATRSILIDESSAKNHPLV